LPSQLLIHRNTLSPSQDQYQLPQPMNHHVRISLPMNQELLFPVTRLRPMIKDWVDEILIVSSIWGGSGATRPGKSVGSLSWAVFRRREWTLGWTFCPHLIESMWQRQGRWAGSGGMESGMHGGRKAGRQARARDRGRRARLGWPDSDGQMRWAVHRNREHRSIMVGEKRA
jgi:hypothetical protein